MLLHGMDDEDMNRDVTHSWPNRLAGCITRVYTQYLPGPLILMLHAPLPSTSWLLLGCYFSFLRLQFLYLEFIDTDW